MNKILPWWLAASLGLIIYPCLTYLPVYFADAGTVTFCKNLAPIICFGLFLYGAIAIYEKPTEEHYVEEEPKKDDLQ